MVYMITVLARIAKKTNGKRFIKHLRLKGKN